MFDRTIKPYILILALIFADAFLAGTLAPSSTRQQITDAFQVVADNYRGLAGEKLFFTILLHNVMATIIVLISCVLVGIIPTFIIGANGRTEVDVSPSNWEKSLSSCLCGKSIALQSTIAREVKAYDNGDQCRHPHR